ncbi:MAG TPA: flagellar hook-basal body complex protein FliE [Sphingomonadaceae bacterium]|nr:flagellar hook-basal body complex protein FliE [Sphingomonadaceae bacterium]
MTRIDSSGLLAMRSAILQQNAALQKAAGVGAAEAPGVSGPGATSSAPAGASFGGALTSALTQVNDLQARSADMASSYERGETTDIAAVMLAREKASVGFQATLQVRNKLLSAYKDIMSMPV